METGGRKPETENRKTGEWGTENEERETRKG